SPLCDGVRLAPAGDDFVRQKKIRATHMENRNFTAAAVDCKQKRAVFAESERSLRFERVSRAAGSAAASGEFLVSTQRAVGGPHIRDHLVVRDIVRHYKNGAGTCGGRSLSQGFLPETFLRQAESG